MRCYSRNGYFKQLNVTIVTNCTENNCFQTPISSQFQGNKLLLLGKWLFQVINSDIFLRNSAPFRIYHSTCWHLKVTLKHEFDNNHFLYILSILFWTSRSVLLTTKFINKIAEVKGYNIFVDNISLKLYYRNATIVVGLDTPFFWSYVTFLTFLPCRRISSFSPSRKFFSI